MWNENLKGKSFYRDINGLQDLLHGTGWLVEHSRGLGRSLKCGFISNASPVLHTRECRCSLNTYPMATLH